MGLLKIIPVKVQLRPSKAQLWPSKAYYLLRPSKVQLRPSKAQLRPSKAWIRPSKDLLTTYAKKNCEPTSCKLQTFAASSLLAGFLFFFFVFMLYVDTNFKVCPYPYTLLLLTL